MNDLVAFQNREMPHGLPTAAKRKSNVKTITAVIATMVGVGLACSAIAQVQGHPGEAVELNSLPASVQQTIKQKTAGGEVVQVRREDDSNGKWNYEVLVKTNGKESAFEVDPNGKFVKQHSEIKR
jgi:molecular chaperone DnaK (HSP70)